MMKLKLTLLGLLCTTLVSKAEKPPNILLIMADDLGWYDVHFNGNEHLDTPNLDRLVEQGMVFPHGYAAAPVCTPTRAAMMTGVSPARLGITNHAPGFKDGMVPEGRTQAGAKKLTYLPLEAQTLAERLKSEVGYATGFVGKWHLSHRKGENEAGEKYELGLRPKSQGFEVNIGGYDRGGPPTYFAPYKIPTLKEGPEGEYLPDRLATECINFIEKQRNGPFFLTFWNYSVHYPIEAPEDLIEKYKKRPVENAPYSAMIEGMDRSIGRVLKSLDDLGLAEDTIVIFTSDNGSLFGNGPLRANKGHLYEGGIRVPWVIRWPGKVKAGSSSNIPIITTDTFPTLLEVVGLKPKKGIPLDGESLIPILKGDAGLKRKSLFFHYPNYAFHKRNRLGGVVRRGNYKLIHFYDDNSIELYDVVADQGENKNLAGTKLKLAADLKNELAKWLKESGAKMPFVPKTKSN